MNMRTAPSSPTAMGRVYLPGHRLRGDTNPGKVRPAGTKETDRLFLLHQKRLGRPDSSSGAGRPKTKGETH